MSLLSEVGFEYIAGLIDLKPAWAKYRMDGTDNINLRINGARVETLGNLRALYLYNQGDNAHAPVFRIGESNFTMAIWLKSLERENRQWVIRPDKGLRVRIEKRHLSVTLSGVGSKLVSFEIHVKIWYHMAVTWNYEAKHIKIYMNGTLMDEAEPAKNQIDESGTVLWLGNGPDGNIPFKGWLREFLAIPRVLTANEIVRLKDDEAYYGGVWTGLNDNKTEGVFEWSKGGHPVYVPNIGSNDVSQNCVSLSRKPSVVNWYTAKCSAEMQFICELSTA